METRENKILVPVDFSEHSLAGLEQAYSLARFSNSDIILLHVFTDNNVSLEHYEKVKAKFKEFTELASKNSGLKISYKLEQGKLIETIIEAAEELKVKMIVVGTTTTKGFAQLLWGSNDMKLIKEAKCPVVTLKDSQPRKNIKNIILPLDLTKETKQKISTAIHLAKFFGGRIYAVSVATTPVEYDQEKMRQQLAQVQSYIESFGIECEIRFKRTSGGNEKIAKELLNFADEVKGDIMLIMVQQEGDFSEIVIGSLAKEIIHKAKIPVMSIRPQKNK